MDRTIRKIRFTERNSGSLRQAPRGPDLRQCVASFWTMLSGVRADDVFSEASNSPAVEELDRPLLWSCCSCDVLRSPIALATKLASMCAVVGNICRDHVLQLISEDEARRLRGLRPFCLARSPRRTAPMGCSMAQSQFLSLATSEIVLFSDVFLGQLYKRGWIRMLCSRAAKQAVPES